MILQAARPYQVYLETDHAIAATVYGRSQPFSPVTEHSLQAEEVEEVNFRAHGMKIYSARVLV